MNLYPSPKELAEEALRALAANPMTPEEHFEFLVAQGIIDRQGRCIAQRMFGGDEQEQPDGTTPPTPSGNGTATPPVGSPASQTP